MSLSSKRQAVAHIRDTKKISERRACQLVGLARSSYYRKPWIKIEDEQLKKRIRDLSNLKKRYGYRMICATLRQEGSRINHKKVHRIWREEGLQMTKRRKTKRRLKSAVDSIVRRAECPNHVWSYDFVEDSTINGKKIRCLVVLDEFTRESLQIRLEGSFPARKVINTLEWLFMTRGVPEFIRSDNGPEFISQAVTQWLTRKGVQTIFIKPGSPWENGHVESFNGTFRDECLNRYLFTDLFEAQQIIEEFRQEYNEYRPHSSLKYETPGAFARNWKRGLKASPSSPLNTNSESTKIQEGTLSLTMVQV